jgi:monooxygenase
VLRRMRSTGTRTVVPVRDESVDEVPLMDFDAGYVQRVVHTLPRQGTVAPWSLKQSYLHDALAIRTARLDDGVLVWS